MGDLFGGGDLMGGFLEELGGSSLGTFSASKRARAAKSRTNTLFRLTRCITTLTARKPDPPGSMARGNILTFFT
jgi:hypothetical protein